MPDLNEQNKDKKPEQQEDANQIITKPLERVKESLVDNKNNQSLKVKSNKETLVSKKSEKNKKHIQKNKRIRIISKNKRNIRNARKKYLLKIKKGKEQVSEQRLKYVRSKTRQKQMIKRNFRRLSNQPKQRDQKNRKTTEGTTDQTFTTNQNRKRQRELQRLKNRNLKEGSLTREQLNSLSRKNTKSTASYPITSIKTKHENPSKNRITKKRKNVETKNDKKKSKKGNPKKKVNRNKRKQGKSTLVSKRNWKKNLSSNLTGKLGVKGRAQELLINKFGRDEHGELNIIGVILTVIFILLSLKILTIMVIVVAMLAVIIAVISVFLAIWTFIVALFTIKTEDMALSEAYAYVTYLDAYKNKDIYDRYNQLVEDYDKDKVTFKVNGVAADPKNFSFSSNADNYVYYLNAKYEDYDIENSAITDYLKRLKQNTDTYIPGMLSIYAEMKDVKPIMDESPVKIVDVKDEIHAMHDATITYNVKVKDDKVTMDVKIQSLGELLDFDPELEIYSDGKVIGTIPAFSEDEIDKYAPVLEIDRFESKIFMNNPLGQDKYSPVISQYGYRGRNDSDSNNEIILSAEPQTPVYATTSEEVLDIDSYTARDSDGKEQTTQCIKTDTGSYQAYYINVTPTVRKGTQLKEGDLIGYTRNEFSGNLLMAIKEKRDFLHKNPYVVPVVFIDHLTYADRTKFSYYDTSQLTGELIYPPEKVTKWKEKVEEEAKKYNLLSYTNTILSIIWVESGGDEEKIPDIMGIEKAKGSTKSVSPEQSIESGVEYFAKLLKKAQLDQLGDLAAVQAYNYGEAYLDDLIRLNTKYTFDNARLYAKEKSSGHTTSCNEAVALNLGYNWRYTFGDMFYAKKVAYNISNNDNKMVQIAKEEIGTPNGDKYWQWGGFTSRVEWSALFVGWVADQAGYIDQGRVIKTASSSDMMKWFKENKKFVAPDEEYMPQPGDLVFFDWDGKKTGKDHVGIVEFNGGNIIQVIEGNTDNLVRRSTYTLDNPTISGYGTP